MHNILKSYLFFSLIFYIFEYTSLCLFFQRNYSSLNKFRNCFLNLILQMNSKKWIQSLIMPIQPNKHFKCFTFHSIFHLFYTYVNTMDICIAIICISMEGEWVFGNYLDQKKKKPYLNLSEFLTPVLDIYEDCRWSRKRWGSWRYSLWAVGSEKYMYFKVEDHW